MIRIPMLVVLTGMAIGQSPIRTLTGGTNGGNIGGSIALDLQVNTTVTITQIDFRCGPNTLPGMSTVEVFVIPGTYVGNLRNQTAWTLAATTVPVFVTPSTVGLGPLATPLTLAPGSFGVLLRATRHSNGYTNGTGTNETFTTAELTLRAGAAQGIAFVGPEFSPRVFNGAIHYVIGNGAGLASLQPLGESCPDFAQSFYEFWDGSVGFDLGNTSMQLVRLPDTSYLALPGSSPMVAHSPTNLPLGHAADTDLALTLDAAGPAIQVPTRYGLRSTRSVYMHSNGVVGMGYQSYASGAPNATGWCSNWRPAFGTWRDLDPSQPGASTHYEYMPGLGAHVFSWLNCPDAGVANTSNSFQVLFFGAVVEFRWGAMNAAVGSFRTLCGFSTGFAAYDPGGRDLSATMPFQTNSRDYPGAELTMTDVPRLGTAPSWMLGRSGAQSLAILAISPNGIPAGLPLTALGLSECRQYVANAGMVAVMFPLGVAPATLPAVIPAAPSLLGQVSFAQAVLLGSVHNTALGIGLETSNALRLQIGR